VTAAIIFVGRALFVLDGALSCIHGRGCCLPPFRCGRGARDGFCVWGHPHCVWAWWALATMALTPTGAVSDASTTAPCAEGLSDQRPKSLENSPFFFGFSAGVSSSAGAAGSESVSEAADSPAVSSVALGAESVLSAATPDAAASPETDGSGVPAGSACSGTFSRRSSETGLSAEPAVVSAASADC
jgi:hypothetical protein